MQRLREIALTGTELAAATAATIRVRLLKIGAAIMRNVETYDECIQVQTEYRGMVEVRAKEQGVNLMVPRQNMCENLKASGVLK